MARSRPVSHVLAPSCLLTYIEPDERKGTRGGTAVHACNDLDVDNDVDVDVDADVESLRCG